MKQRVTYVLPQDTELDPANIHVRSDEVDLTSYHNGAIEKRLTIGLSELPPEFASLFKDLHEIHVRYSPRKYHDVGLPFVSRLPPGLHVFFTPLKDHPDVDVCTLLRNAFSYEIKCHSVAESFSNPNVLAERFTSSSAYQYYQPVTHLRRLGALVRSHASCTYGECIGEVDLLGHVDSLDIDFDAISHAVTLTTRHHATNGTRTLKGPAVEGVVHKSREGDSVEVGVLQLQKPDEDEPESLKLGGFLTVIGEDDHPGPTLFSFPSRHHSLPVSTPARFGASFQQPTGLHPKLEITLPRKHLTPPAESCALHAYLTLPSALFIDRYQLSDPLFLKSQNLVALRTLSGEDDLESPEWVIKRWGSASLLELAHPPAATASQEGDWTVTIPTHLRYLSSNASLPIDEFGQVMVEIPWPAVFWACDAQEGLKMATNPFDRVNIGYDGLFGPRTMFYHIPPALPAGGELIERLHMPVIEPEKAAWVQGGTLAAVVVGFAWVCWRLLKGTGGKAQKVTKKTE